MLDVVLGLVELAQDDLGVAIKHLARLGGRDTAFGAHEQLLSEFAFQCRQLLAECGLGDMQHVSGLGQAADVNDLDKIFESPKVQLCL